MKGYRKFSAYCLAVVCASVLCWFGRIEDGTFQVVIVAAIGAYMAGNVMTKRATADGPSNP